MQVTRITFNDNSKPNFKALHVLHLPEQYAIKPKNIIAETIRKCSPENKPLSKILRQFTDFVNNKINPTPEINFGTGVTLKDGKTAYVRLTDKSDIYNVYFRPESAQKAELTKMTENNEAIHYIIDENNQIKNYKSSHKQVVS